MVWEGRDAVKTGRSMCCHEPPPPPLTTPEGFPALTNLSHSSPRCYQPSCLRPWHHPCKHITLPTQSCCPAKLLLIHTTGRLRYRRWPQRLPRLRQRRERQEGDRPVVQGGGAHQLEERLRPLDLREAVDAASVAVRTVSTYLPTYLKYRTKRRKKKSRKPKKDQLGIVGKASRQNNPKMKNS